RPALKHVDPHHDDGQDSRTTSRGYVTLVTLGTFGDRPVQVTCPNCGRTGVTKVEFKSGLLTYLFCTGMFFCGFVLGCCLIPFCINRLRDAKHSCSTCRAPLGVYKRL
ncbi:LITAF domain-containing protein-like, partial [Trichomycterus rosablanca]|uniref:LITAF domain-containing protein-like n=1 Tax=Trichomycterus rosablanca TaxID=2290929 RepID=UPI002F353DC5